PVEAMEAELDLIAATVQWPVVGVVFVFEGKAPMGVARKQPKVYEGRTLYAGTLNVTHRMLKLHQEAPVPDGILIGL
ncbi:MAG: hypothetical protein ACYCW6_12950, partial [Candidatus Xenobia bacterium]